MIVIVASNRHNVVDWKPPVVLGRIQVRHRFHVQPVRMSISQHDSAENQCQVVAWLSIMFDQVPYITGAGAKFLNYVGRYTLQIIKLRRVLLQRVLVASLNRYLDRTYFVK